MIAGASVTGVSAADTLRQEGFSGTITLLSDETVQPYDRPPLSKAFLLEPESELAHLRDLGHFEEIGVELKVGHGAAGLDIDRRYVITTDGDPLPWDHVIIATGSSPERRVTAQGHPVPTLRTAADARVLREVASTYDRVTLIGAGFISLELAAALRLRGIGVTLIGGGELPLRSVLGEDVAATVRRLHADHGVDLRLGSNVEEIDGQLGDFRLHLSDGTEHRAPFVVAGIGSRPNTAWLDGAGVDLDETTGAVLCDGAGRTSVPGVWSAGDAAVYDRHGPGPRAHGGHWTNASQQGRHVARNIAAGAAEPYTAVPYFWTDQYDRKIQCYGHRENGDETVVVGGSLDSGTYLVIYGRPETAEFHGVLSNGMDRSLRPYLKLLRAGADWDAALQVPTAA